MVRAFLEIFLRTNWLEFQLKYTAWLSSPFCNLYFWYFATFLTHKEKKKKEFISQQSRNYFESKHWKTEKFAAFVIQNIENENHNLWKKKKQTTNKDSVFWLAQWNSKQKEKKRSFSISFFFWWWMRNDLKIKSCQLKLVCL